MILSLARAPVDERHARPHGRRPRTKVIHQHRSPQRIDDVRVARSAVAVTRSLRMVAYAPTNGKTPDPGLTGACYYAHERNVKREYLKQNSWGSGRISARSRTITISMKPSVADRVDKTGNPGPESNASSSI